MSKTLGLNEWWGIVDIESGFCFLMSLSSGRSGAIGRYNDWWENPNEYERNRRRGLVRCERVEIVRKEGKR